MSTTLAGLVSLGVFPACSGGGSHAIPPGCTATSSPNRPRALIGPDVDVLAFCGGTAQAPIASVYKLGTGVTRWSFTVRGDAAFRPLVNTFASCQASNPVAFVLFAPPADALPGSLFDASATVHADDGSFADGRVKLHGEIIKPVITVDKASVDFGNVAPGDNPTIPLHFTNAAPLFLRPVAEAADSGAPNFYAYPPFVISNLTPGGLDLENFTVTLATNVPGDTATPRAGPAVRSRATLAFARSTTTDEIADIHSDVARDHPEQRRRDVTPWMKRHGGRSTVGVTILLMRPTLTDLDESQAFQDGRDFARLQNRNITHGYATLTVCVPTNSPSNLGSPSSKSMVTTSSRFCRSSSTVAP